MTTPVVLPASRAHIQLFAQSEGSPVRWRVLSGNNRELGRGSGEFPDQESCVLGIKHLQAVVADLDPSVVRDSTSAWRWTLSLGGVSVANSGHSYDRLIRCRLALTYFVTHLGTSQVTGALMLTQSRRWTTPTARIRTSAQPAPRGRS